MEPKALCGSTSVGAAGCCGGAGGVLVSELRGVEAGAASGWLVSAAFGTAGEAAVSVAALDEGARSGVEEDPTAVLCDARAG